MKSTLWKCCTSKYLCINLLVVLYIYRLILECFANNSLSQINLIASFATTSNNVAKAGIGCFKLPWACCFCFHAPHNLFNKYFFLLPHWLLSCAIWTSLSQMRLRNLSLQADTLNKVLDGILPLIYPPVYLGSIVAIKLLNLHDMLANLLISKGLKAFGFLVMIGMKGVLLLSILSLNFSCGRWIFLAMRKRKLVSFLPGVSFCKFNNNKMVIQHIIMIFLDLTDY